MRFLPDLFAEHPWPQLTTVHERSDHPAQRYPRLLHNCRSSTENLDQRDLRGSQIPQPAAERSLTESNRIPAFRCPNRHCDNKAIFRYNAIRALRVEVGVCGVRAPKLVNDQGWRSAGSAGIVTPSSDGSDYSDEVCMLALAKRRFNHPGLVGVGPP